MDSSHRSPISVPLPILLAFYLIACSGCGSNERRGVSGTVTLDGQPIDTGRISFRPIAGTSGPGAGGSIKSGQYIVAAEKGLMPGDYRVEIMAWKKTGRKVPALSGELIDEITHIIPPRYNKISELKATVSSAGENKSDFALTSK